MDWLTTKFSKLKGLRTKLRWQSIVKLTLFCAIIIFANLMSEFVAEQLKMDLRPSNENRVHWMITTSAFLYFLLIAIPFVPGVEIGLGLIAMFGAPIVFLVYVTTIAGLSLSFAIGYFISRTVLIDLLESLGAVRAAGLIRDISKMNRYERLEFLAEKAPNRIVPFLLRYRYLALALAINLPGSFLIGGGGGISLMAGTSRLFSFPGFVLTIALAVSPIPLAVILFDYKPM